MAQAALQGARDIAHELEAETRLDCRLQAAEHVAAHDVLGADGLLFCAPENLGSLSGAMKEFFDRVYYDVLDQINGRPYGLLIAAGTDGTGAVRQTERICTGWRLEPIAPAQIILTGAQTPKAIAAPKKIGPDEWALCHTMGGTLAALLL